MSELGPAEMKPMRWTSWDPKGVAAMRAMAEYHRDPNKEMHAPKASLRIEQLTNHFQRLYSDVFDITKVSVEGSRPMVEINTTVRDQRNTDVAGLSELNKLSDIYETLSKSRPLKSAVAHSRIVEDDLDSERINTPRLVQLYYLAFPCMMFFVAFAIQSFLLHLTTHFYVYFMMKEDEFQEDGHARLFDLIGNSVGVATGHKQEGALVRGKAKIPTNLLDASGFIPLLLCLASYVYSFLRGQFSIGLWNKTFIAASCMAIMKGVFDVVTILPDSSGWETCKKRLGSEIDDFQEMEFGKDLDGSFMRLMVLEIFGGESGKRVRYCADMMVSGHTYFAALFSLSAYKQFFLSGVGKFWSRVVGFICVCCMVTEVSLVAAARFHYTVDMLVAVVLVGLLFDSTYVEQIAADWSEGFRWRDPATFKPNCAPLFTRVMRLQGRSTPQVREGDTQPLVSPRGPQAAGIIASRSVGLVNPRITSGVPPWKWQTFADLEKIADKVDQEEMCDAQRAPDPPT